MFDFDDIDDEAPEDQAAEEEQEDPAEVARQAAERLRDVEWKVRWDACRTLAAVGAAAAAHAKVLARVAAKDKDADVRKAATGILMSLRASGVELPADYLDDYAGDDQDAERHLKRMQREKAWAERRKLREQEWEEKRKILEEEEKKQEEKIRADAKREAQRLWNRPLDFEEHTHIGNWDVGEEVVPNTSRREDAGTAQERPLPFQVQATATPQSAAAHAEASPPEPESGDTQETEDEEAEGKEKDGEDLAGAQRRQQEQQHKPRREATAIVPESVSWEGPRANFRIFGAVWPMRLERSDMTPSEVADIWEKSWGILYASRIKFEAPPDAEKKWLHPREDVVPLHPAVVVLHDKAGSVLNSLSTAFKEYGGLKVEEAEDARLHRLQQGKATMDKRAKANARDRERTQLRESRARMKGNTHKEREDRRIQELREMRQSVDGKKEPVGEGPPQRLMMPLKRHPT